LITETLAKVKVTLTTLKESLDKKQIKIDSVEIIGGTTRIPCVQKLIEEVFQT